MSGLDPGRSTAENYRAFSREARGRSRAYESLATSVADDDMVWPSSLRFRRPSASPIYCSLRPGTCSTPRPISARCGTWSAARDRTDRGDPDPAHPDERAARCATLLPALTSLPRPAGPDRGRRQRRAHPAVRPLLLRLRRPPDHRLRPGRADAALRRGRSCAAARPAAGHRLAGRARPQPARRDPRRRRPLAVLPGLARRSDRQARLAAAVASARRDPPAVHRGDLRTDLPAVAARAPADATLVIYHSAVLALRAARGPGAGSPATSGAWAPCGCPTRPPGWCLACRLPASGRGRLCSAATGGRRWPSPTVTGHGFAGCAARASSLPH